MLLAAAWARGRKATFVQRVEAGNVGVGSIALDVTSMPCVDLTYPAATISRTLAPGVMEAVDNVFSQWFVFSQDTPAVGSLSLKVTSGNAADLKVQSVISAVNNSGSEDGQFFKAILSSDGLVAGPTGFFATTENPVRYRTNFGLTSWWLKPTRPWTARPSASP